MTWWRRTTSNKRWNNVAYLNVGIYNVEQCRIMVAYFNVDVNNVRQNRNNVVLFNFEFYSVGQPGSTVVKIAISKKNDNNNKKSLQFNNWIRSFNCYFLISFTLLPILRRICWRILAKPQILSSWKKLCCKNLIWIASLCELVQSKLWLSKFWLEGHSKSLYLL